ncbi:MAG: hypothetical protein P8P32_04885, partial [Akkermansiaceae bacterium]|nr:hypothetical protein [Akkermansiaceae bacterium]
MNLSIAPKMVRRKFTPSHEFYHEKTSRKPSEHCALPIEQVLYPINSLRVKILTTGTPSASIAGRPPSSRS